MKRTLKIVGLMSVAAAGVATYLRNQAAEREDRTLVANDHNVCRQLNQAMDRFEERFGT